MADKSFKKKAKSFIKELIALWEIKGLQFNSISYIGEINLQNDDKIECRYIFKKNNSELEHIDVIIDIDLFNDNYEKYIDQLEENIRNLYNKKEVRDFMKNDTRTHVDISSSFQKTNLYEVKVSYKGEDKIICFNLDAKEFFH